MCIPEEFDHPMKLHCSQTNPTHHKTSNLFDHPMKLHCSQTDMVKKHPEY